jgi:hypothetical protein
MLEKRIPGKSWPVPPDVVDFDFRLGMLLTEGIEIPVKVLRTSADIWE